MRWFPQVEDIGSQPSWFTSGLCCSLSYKQLSSSCHSRILPAPSPQTELDDEYFQFVGVISTLKALDHESNHLHEIIVKVNDNGLIEYSDYAKVIVRVLVCKHYCYCSRMILCLGDMWWHVPWLALKVKVASWTSLTRSELLCLSQWIILKNMKKHHSSFTFKWNCFTFWVQFSSSTA